MFNSIICSKALLKFIQQEQPTKIQGMTFRDTLLKDSCSPTVISQAYTLLPIRHQNLHSDVSVSMFPTFSQPFQFLHIIFHSDMCFDSLLVSSKVPDLKKLIKLRVLLHPIYQKHPQHFVVSSGSLHRLWPLKINTG